MDEKDLKKQLDELKSALETAITEKNKKEIDAIAEQLKTLAESTKGFADLQATVKKLNEDAALNQKALDDLIAKSKDVQLNGGSQFKSFEDALGEALTKREKELKEFKVAKKGFGGVELQQKVVGNMGSSTNITGTYFVQPTVLPGVKIKMFEGVHMRDLLPVGNTNSNVVRYVQDNGGEGGPTMVAEAATKPQIDRDLEIKDAPVRKIATYFRVPEEMIDDIPYLQSFLGQIGVEEVMVVEDNQILYGDGTGQNLTGFNVAGTAFAAGTSVIGASANEFDVIGAAKKQIRVAKFGGSLVALLNPVDYFNMRYARKDTSNNYLFQGGGNGIDVGLQVDGVRIYEHTAVTSGGFFVFDPRAAQIFDRAGTTVRFYDQDQDNAIKNLITIVIEKRLALAIYHPTAIIRGTFAAAITDLTT